MGDFLGLLDSLDPDVRVRGRQFEHVCKWFLTNGPQYRNMLRRVWLWDDWPGYWGPDAGIDLVAEDHEGRLWAVQAKAYDPKYAVTKADVDTFLSESSRKIFSYRLLISTTDKLSPNARRTLEGQEKDVGIVRLSDLLTAVLDWPTSVDALHPAAPPERATPRDYQRDAIDAVVAGFDSDDRGQLIMACGTGKTLTAQFIVDDLEARRTLVLVPSLSLLKQTMKVWQANARTGFEVLPVCSDATVGRNADEAVSHVSELGLPVTTDPADIAAFLRKRSGRRVIFSTYQSSPRIAAAYELGRVPAFDLVIADEAHRCAGPVSSEFATVLDAAAIKAKRRLFMTATPRYYTGRIVRAAEEADFEVASMDDEARFGKVFHRLGFSEAIERDLLTDYQVVVVGVDDTTYLQWAERGTLVTRDGKNITDARSLAGQIGLAKAMRKYDLRRVISFHSRVKRAREFAAELPEVVDWMPAGQRPKGQLWAYAATGEMSAGERHILLQRLAQIDNGERGLLTNAQCLAEGVDIPALDGVAFIDPRRSEVDIVQAVGRAIRKSEDKTVGTIVIPAFIDTHTDPEKALEDSVFKPVWDVVKALRAHDQNLAEELDSLRRSMVRRRGVPLLPSKIRLDLPVQVGTDFVRAFDTRLVEQTTATWEFWIGLLERYVAENRTAWVAQSERFENHRLGAWVNNQRRLGSLGQLDSDRYARLDRLPGWSWAARDDRWEQTYALLVEYVEQAGDARVSQSYVVDGVKLGSWVREQRGRFADGSLEADRQRRLESLPQWSWNAREDNWEDAFQLLLRYVEEHGHARVPKTYEADGFPLGRWVSRQRTWRVKGTLSANREARLTVLPGWVWDLNTALWEDGFDRTVSYATEHGDTRVPQDYEVDGYRLGAWVGQQRTLYTNGALDADRIQRLENVPGWVWDTRPGRWEDQFNLVVDYVAEHGDARVPQSYKVGVYNIGHWAQTQRGAYSRGELDVDRQRRLEALPGWSWTARADRWERNYALVVDYAAKHGTALVPQSYRIGDCKLGLWVNEQRSTFAKHKLSSDRQRRLEALPGWFWDLRGAKWDEGFRRAKRFVQEHGHSRIPVSYEVADYRLGHWAANQRRKHARGDLPEDRVRQLEQLPNWTWRAGASPATGRATSGP